MKWKTFHCCTSYGNKVYFECIKLKCCSHYEQHNLKEYFNNSNVI